MFFKCFTDQFRKRSNNGLGYQSDQVELRFDFEIVRNNFGEWLGVWKMRVPGVNRDLLKFFQRTKIRFIDVCENEVRTLKSVKIQFSLLVGF